MKRKTINTLLEMVYRTTQDKEKNYENDYSERFAEKKLEYGTTS
jgi:hypothetical protein